MHYITFEQQKSFMHAWYQRSSIAQNQDACFRRGKASFSWTCNSSNNSQSVALFHIISVQIGYHSCVACSGSSGSWSHSSCPRSIVNVICPCLYKSPNYLTRCSDDGFKSSLLFTFQQQRFSSGVLRHASVMTANPGLPSDTILFFHCNCLFS